MTAGLSHLETRQQMFAIVPQLLPQGYLSSTYQQWRTEGGGALGCSNTPPEQNSWVRHCVSALCSCKQATTLLRLPLEIIKQLNTYFD